MTTTPAGPLSLGELDRGPRRTWQRVDLGPVLDGTYAPPQATVGRRTDGVGMFYPGRQHSIASDSEAGKTWLALLAAQSELDAGNAVLYLDFEDDEGGTVGRLMALGAKSEDIAARFGYVKPEEAIDSLFGREDLSELLGDLRPTLAILDGITEAMSMHGLELKDNTDIARFGRLLPRYIADKGAATVALDHVVKDREGRGRYAIGGVHKLNGINGASYVLDNRQPFGIGRTGRTSVYIAKDRPAQLRRHALPGQEGLFWFGDLVVESHDMGFAEGMVSPPAQGDGKFRPTTLMARVSAALQGAPGPLTMTDITDRVKGQAQTVRGAVAALVDEGHIVMETGPRGAKLHRLVKPFGDTP
ncbi:AAA family ATPase [Micromonospora sp. ALFpr18c]|uniref:AAA family ATPase n=1 Tax=unclassified Micromonospora TaxID=2617518 RepID=UPI00124BC58A|nr:AAA family ATPase [Micromonospora sp. ALFpr18c]KAB1933427.1 AAA family ATPase [Micromonospora sp. ALFpr18c]